MSKLLSQKCTYAVRAIFDLARESQGAGSELAPITTIATIAERQDIPLRFLEGILRELRQGGFVDSKRGADGGYRLAQSAASIPVGEVIRFIEGDLATAKPAEEETAFDELLREAQGALWEVFDGASFQDLVDRAALREGRWSGDYVI